MGAVACPHCRRVVTQGMLESRSLVRRVLGESQEPSKPFSMAEAKPIVVKQRQVEFDACPHCGQEIFEKHTWIDGDFRSGNYMERHSDCGGAVIRKPFDWSTVSPEWRAMLGVRESQGDAPPSRQADGMAALDDLIAAHTKKLELLKAHKKGLMQHLAKSQGQRPVSKTPLSPRCAPSIIRRSAP